MLLKKWLINRHPCLISYYTNKTEETILDNQQIKKLIKAGALNKHFKPGAKKKDKYKAIRMLPGVGAAADALCPGRAARVAKSYQAQYQ